MKKQLNQKLITITCPYCGREYLPGEIYLPKSFLGQPENIDRDNNGKIDIFDGSTMDLSESYVCDYCNEKFNIIADVRFRTNKPDNTFDTVYTSEIYMNRISLFEGD